MRKISVRDRLRAMMHRHHPAPRAARARPPLAGQLRARDRIVRAAAALRQRLHGTVVVPAIRSPLERSLITG